MTTQEFELPISCPTCQAMRTAWSIERRYASDSGTEQATYKCGCRMEFYPTNHRDPRITNGCPKDSAQIAKAAREKIIDEAVARLLIRLKVTEAEAKAFVRRVGRGWATIDDPNIFSYMRFPKEK